LSEAEVQAVGNDVLARLEHVNEFLGDEQWDDAVETLRRVMENGNDRLIRLPSLDQSATPLFSTYVPVRDYCQIQLASWHFTAPAALALYRQRVDNAARQWFEDGKRNRDESKLQRIVDAMMLSSFGDDALLLLGDIALERAHYATARQWWERISPLLRTPSAAARVLGCRPGLPLWLALRSTDLEEKWEEISPALTTVDEAAGRLVYPDTDVSLAAVRARLVLVSILEGAVERAELELEVLRRLHPEQQGVLAGRDGKYHEILTELLQESRAWPATAESSDWPVFAGNEARNKTAPGRLDVARRVVWQATLPAITAARERIGETRIRVAESEDALLSYHVAVADGVVYIHQPGILRALRLDTGDPRFSAASRGQLAQDSSYGEFYKWTSHPVKTVPERFAYSGIPRYAVSVHGHRLFARMGVGWTGGGNEVAPRPEERSFLIGIDLRTQKLLFDRVFADESGWEFESSPVCDGSRIYVSQRRRDQVNAQARVVCIDVQTGRLVWTTDVARGEVPGGVLYQLTNSALSLHQGRLYLSTHLGAVAALRVSDGRIEWLSSYRRSGPAEDQPDRNDRYLFRDLTPCVVDRGQVIAAPADSDRLFSIDTGTGQILWCTPAGQAADAIHLLGVGQGRLLASGDYLYWFDAYTGQLVGQFPSGRAAMGGYAGPNPRGFGRGILTDSQVYWPTRNYLYVFDQRYPQLVRQPIELSRLGITGGNLVVAEGCLVIAGADRVMVLRDSGRP
jgi:outer membrane protein assembly factor BamB